MKKINKKIKIVILITSILIIISQALTIYAVTNVKDESKSIIPNVLRLTYVENTGGAFGIGGNGTIGFVIVSLIIIGIIIRFLVLQQDKLDLKTCLSLGFILAGGISNLIERIMRGFVVDYIDISELFKFPVFNLADMLIFIGWITLVIFIFIYWNKELKNK